MSPVAPRIVERLVDGPDLADIQAGLPARAHLLESKTQGGALARFSLLFAPASHWLEGYPAGRLQLDAHSEQALDLGQSVDFFTAMRAFTDHYQRRQHAALHADGSSKLPFNGGFSFYLGFECSEWLEPVLNQPAFAEPEFPVAVVEYHPAAIIRDHSQGVDYLVDDGSRAGALASEQLHAAWLHPTRPDTAFSVHDLTPPDGTAYQRAVEQVRAYLLAGDVFQANISHAWRFQAAGEDIGYGLYQALGRRNPAPFAARYRHPAGQVLSSSPERLMQYDRTYAHTRPIAGTRRRVTDPEADQRLIAELCAHPKERAEHVMLIDLERNDLGRVCQPGTVEVNELMVVESYAHVHHLVSNVRGRPRDDQHIVDLLAACFPGGTITGCPKVRCLEILAELEQTGRGPYTGSIGYISNDGFCDSNILIRSLFVNPQGKGEFRTGAGIVVDSQPARELTETWEKARGLLHALGLDETELEQLQARS